MLDNGLGRRETQQHGPYHSLRPPTPQFIDKLRRSAASRANHSSQVTIPPLQTMAKPRPIFVFDNPRTYSHVFGKIFSAHPDLERIYHPYLLTGTHSPERIQLGLQHNTAAQAADDELVKVWGSWPPEMKASYADITAATVEQVDGAAQNVVS